jgi:hypothetical protein
MFQHSDRSQKQAQYPGHSGRPDENTAGPTATEFSGIEETETEMEEIMKYLDALQGILDSTKKLVS